MQEPARNATAFIAQYTIKYSGTVLLRMNSLRSNFLYFFFCLL